MPPSIDYNLYIIRYIIFTTLQSTRDMINFCSVYKEGRWLQWRLCGARIIQKEFLDVYGCPKISRHKNVPEHGNMADIIQTWL